MSEYIAETFTHAGLRIQIIADTDAESPEDWETGEDIGIVTTRNRYFSLQQGSFKDPDELNPRNKANKETLRQYWVFPLYMYAHSGVSLSLGNSSYPFTDPWDSGQVGFVYVKKLKENKWTRSKRARQAAESYVETWNMFLSGDVWGYTIERSAEHSEDCEENCTDCQPEDLDSCWGMYGLDYCKQQAIEQAEYFSKQSSQAQQAQTTNENTKA